jgi:hypothetical protein
VLLIRVGVGPAAAAGGPAGGSWPIPPQSPQEPDGPQPFEQESKHDGGAGSEGPQPWNGQQPRQQTVPQHTGVKALYCRQQIFMSQQQRRQQQQLNQADAELDAMPARARLNKPAANSFFMVCGFFS